MKRLIYLLQVAVLTLVSFIIRLVSIVIAIIEWAASNVSYLLHKADCWLLLQDSKISNFYTRVINKSTEE